MIIYMITYNFYLPVSSRLLFLPFSYQTAVSYFKIPFHKSISHTLVSYADIFHIQLYSLCRYISYTAVFHAQIIPYAAVFPVQIIPYAAVFHMQIVPCYTSTKNLSRKCDQFSLSCGYTIPQSARRLSHCFRTAIVSSHFNTGDSVIPSLMH